MKQLRNRTGGFLPALLLAVAIAFGLPAQKVQAQDYYGNNNYYGDDGYYDDGNYQEFYDDLAPYGQWFSDPQYGYVWAPNVGRDFRPYYTNGYWAMTDYGNMWMSNYAWGWAPFHYGRWAQSALYGWIWVPGSVWGPAWVNWRQGGGYYGWAPMGPGVSINVSFGSGFNVPNPWWTFIPCGNIYSRNFYNYYSPRRTVNIINNTTIINNTYVDNRTRNTYIAGPRRTDVERYTGRRVTVYNVNNRSRAGAASVSGRNVNVYRPTIGRVSERSQSRPAPGQVKAVERSLVTNAGGGRAPSRPTNAVERGRQGEVNRAAESGQRVQGGRQVQRQSAQQQRMQQSQQQQQQRMQGNQQRRQMEQQRMQADQQRQVQQQQQQQRIQADQQRQQQVQQQRMQADQQRQQQVQQQQRMQADQQRQQMQRQQQMQQQQVQQQRIQADQQRQQMQQQRAQQQQQMQQQRMQADQQRQQMQQQRVQQQQSQQQRSVERSQPQPRNVDRGGGRSR